MPKSLILLEEHLGTGAKLFIVNHAAALKALGYSKFLLEMNHEISPAQMKQEIQYITQNAPDTLMYRSIKVMGQMLHALEQHGISYEFVDPETRKEAEQHTVKLKAAYASGSTEQVRRITEATNVKTKRRDEQISKSVLQQTKAHKGGVIYLGGFLHQSLVHTLEQSTYDYRFVMFADSREEYEPPGMSRPDLSRWSEFYNEMARKNFYQADVTFFNMAYEHHLSFEMIAAACDLTESRALAEDEQPGVARAFDRLMPFYDYRVDEQCVVTASKRVDKPEAAVRAFVKAGLGLRFFMTSLPDGTTQVNVPGLNLKESRGSIAASEMSLG